MTAARGTRRAQVLAYLEHHPGRTAYEIAAGLGYRREQLSSVAGRLTRLLQDMEREAEVVATAGWRPGQGRHVSLWHAAPAGTIPPPRPEPSAGDAEPDRVRNRVNQRRLPARRRGPSASAATAVQVLPGGPACRGADPDLFFPLPGESSAPAKAVCAACPVRAGCLALARARGERFGIWGGVNLEAGAGTARPA